MKFNTQTLAQAQTHTHTAKTFSFYNQETMDVGDARMRWKTKAKMKENGETEEKSMYKIRGDL